MYRRTNHLRIRSFIRSLRTQAQHEHGYELRDALETAAAYRPAGLATPRQLVQYLDEYVIGQENAKKVLSVAVFNHYNRVRSNLSQIEESEAATSWSERRIPDEQLGVSSAEVHPHPQRSSSQLYAPFLRNPIPPLFEKSNVLMIGPTGSGKTLLAKTLARVLDVPFSSSDATSFTQAGYVGEDVDMCIQRLLQAANWDEKRASTGIVYIDEADKLARKNGGIEGQRDVGGEGVQQALLKIMEGTTVTIHTKPPASDPGPLGGEGRNRSGQQRPTPPPEPRTDTYSIDTSNILFILSGAFVGLDGILRQRLAKGSIGFNATLSRSTEGDANGFVPFFTPNRKASTNILELVEPADIVKYGYIPEFISRLPTVTSLAQLTPADLLRILTDVRGSLVSQYTALFGYSGVEIRFTTLALKEICRQAAERGGGARALRGIMENLLLDAMYEVPYVPSFIDLIKSPFLTETPCDADLCRGSNIRHVLINEAIAKGEQPALYWSRGEGAAYWTAWAEEESLSEEKGNNVKD